MSKDQLSSPFRNPHGSADIDGDRRDIHDQNPSFPDARHDRGPGTPANLFIEGEDSGSYVGNVDRNTKDVISSPGQGQRRAATGRYESPRRIDRP